MGGGGGKQTLKIEVATSTMSMRYCLYCLFMFNFVLLFLRQNKRRGGGKWHSRRDEERSETHGNKQEPAKVCVWVEDWRKRHQGSMQWWHTAACILSPAHRLQALCPSALAGIASLGSLSTAHTPPKHTANLTWFSVLLFLKEQHVVCLPEHSEVPAASSQQVLPLGPPWGRI